MPMKLSLLIEHLVWLNIRGVTGEGYFCLSNLCKKHSSNLFQFLNSQCSECMLKLLAVPNPPHINS